MVQRFPVALTADQARPKTAEHAETWLEAAFRQHWSRVYAVLFRLVGDGDEAEDLALETFWRLYHYSPGLEEDKLGGWLYRVATNLGFNALRSRRRRKQYEARAGASALEQSKPLDPAQALEQIQERQRVQTALERMKPRSARLLVLRYSGLTYTEIAEAMDVAPGSVGTLLARAEEEFERHYRQVEGG
jgi:RNA polymerase sigma-70 factor (ECF subfamily)